MPWAEFAAGDGRMWILAVIGNSGTIRRGGEAITGKSSVTNTTIKEPGRREAEQLAALLREDDGLRGELGIAADDRPEGEDVLEKLREWCRKRRATTFAIMAGDTAIGTISLSHRSEEGRTARIGYWVGTRYRRCGHGTRAFATILRRAAAEGITSVSSSVAAWNEGSRRIWERHGATSTPDSGGRIRYEITIEGG